MSNTKTLSSDVLNVDLTLVVGEKWKDIVTGDIYTINGGDDGQVAYWHNGNIKYMNEETLLDLYVNGVWVSLSN